MSLPALLFEETTREQRLRVRRRSFAWQNGIALIAVLRALTKAGLGETLAAAGPGRTLQSARLVAEAGLKPGYANVALRSLASQGWIRGWRAPATPEEARAGFDFEGTATGVEVFRLLAERPALLEAVERSLPLLDRMEAWLFEEEATPEGALLPGEAAPLLARGFDLPRLGTGMRREAARQLRLFLEGLWAAPVLAAAGRRGAFRTLGGGREVRIEDRVDLHVLLPTATRRRLIEHAWPVLEACGWMERQGGAWHLTPEGKAAAFYSPALGVTLSYLPLFRGLPALLQGEARFEELFPRRADGRETHVHRPLNIWGSGGAHDLYFRKVDEILLEIFRGPSPPAAVCDTGCGDGSYLRHIHEVLRDRLHWDFEKHPVWFLGCDLNRESQERARRTLQEGRVPNAHILDRPVDINWPGDLAEGIRELGLVGRDPETGGERPLRAEDALHTNSMLIHNRRYLTPAPEAELPPSTTDGAFVDPAGGIVPGRVLQRNLVEFMERWRPFVERHGWLFIELHTLPVEAVAEDPERTPTIAYDCSHGFSLQYTVEPAVLRAAAEAAGLRPGNEHFQASFPGADRPRVTVNYLRGA